jgi:hypothetical protein
MDESQEGEYVLYSDIVHYLPYANPHPFEIANLDFPEHCRICGHHKSDPIHYKKKITTTSFDEDEGAGDS